MGRSIGGTVELTVNGRQGSLLWLAWSEKSEGIDLRRRL